MKFFKLSLFIYLLCTILSCSTDAIVTNEEDPIVATVDTEDADLLGTWTGIDVSYSGSMTSITNGIATVQNIEGANFDGEYTITFEANPNVITREGLYSINEEITESNGDVVSTSIIDNLNLINSLTNWNLVEDELTMDSGGKIKTATIVELTSTSLVLSIDESTSTTINGVSETLLKNSTFTFVR
ncbi:hypothetical protein [uncultured Dokdonia sp.]|uniref:hypothetical protein n=1 Tax=uncultured Dokdonia sp. TaxID=575653 RepID=UPI002620DD27|nr:hypothetical protein [uncultured Dokdonia sp.]